MISQAKPSIIESRYDQMFPILEPSEIDRVRRFGSVRSFAVGEAVVRAGDVGSGLTVILAGRIEALQRNSSGLEAPIVTQGPGAFLGELAQLAGRPALVDAYAREPVKALIIPPDRLRALIVAEAELGERIMRALILRRIGLLETGAGGPIIVGRADDGDVLRLASFLRSNSYPRRVLDPDTDSEAKALIERFHVDPGELPIVLCPQGQLLRNPTEAQLARCLGLVGPIDPSRIYDVAIVGAGPAGLAAAVYAGSEGLSVLTLDCRARGGQAGAFLPLDGIDKDHFPRRDTSMESLARLKPVFDRTSGRGTLTAGNSSPLTDGAAAIWVADDEGVDRLPKPLPRARPVDFEMAAVDIFHEGLLMAPVPAIPRLLARHGLTFDDIALWEIHEAFSAQVLCHIKALEDKAFVRAKAGVEHTFGRFPRVRMNPNGGSVALGHPFAATGARILSQALKELAALPQGSRAIVSICSDGGLGTVALIQR